MAEVTVCGKPAIFIPFPIVTGNHQYYNGAEGRWNHLGFGAPMIGFVIVYIANQVVSVISTVLIPLGIDSRTGSVQMRIMLPELIDAVRTGTGVTYVGMGALITGPIVAFSLWRLLLLL